MSMQAGNAGDILPIFITFTFYDYEAATLEEQACSSVNMVYPGMPTYDLSTITG